MKNRTVLRDAESAARRRVVALAEQMLSGRITYLEGAAQLVLLEHAVGDIAVGEGDSHDPDFEPFWLITREASHLPLEQQRPLWSAGALARLAPELSSREAWAKSVATGACTNLMQRYRQNGI
jgi:hypothetical protein